MKSAGFNPYSRWDRNMPEGTSADPAGIENERISVLAWFRGTRIIPQRFEWKGKTYSIHTVTYTWQEHRGQELISYFAVNTDPDIYQISFHNRSFSWFLNKKIE
jgi:hypothetical protein